MPKKNIISHISFILGDFNFELNLRLGRPIIKNLQIQIVDHCNLHCRACSHFSNIADKYYMSVDSLSKDLKELYNKFTIGYISILGGEPLLHPNIREIISIIRQYSKSSMVLCTNGLLIPSLDPNLLNFLCYNNVKFLISKYPISFLNISKIVTPLINLDLLANIRVKNEFRKYINEKGNSNIKATYKSCWMKDCITLQDGKLYRCPFGAYVKYFNKKYNTNIAEDKGIDIYKNNASKIYKYIYNPINSCRWCTFEHNLSIPWQNCQKSEIKKEDWCI